MVNRFSNEVICLSQNINGKLSVLVSEECEIEDVYNVYKPICVLWYTNYKQNICILTQCNVMISSPLTAVLHLRIPSVSSFALPSSFCHRKLGAPGGPVIFPRWTHPAKPRATWTIFVLCSTLHPFWHGGTVLPGLVGNRLGLSPS